MKLAGGPGVGNEYPRSRLGCSAFVNGTSAGSINSDVREIEAVMKEKSADVQKELEAHQSFESWGREGQELARTVVYLNGDLKVAASTGRRITSDADVPTAPGGYA
jgi:hypothetical protein